MYTLKPGSDHKLVMNVLIIQLYISLFANLIECILCSWVSIEIRPVHLKSESMSEYFADEEVVKLLYYILNAQTTAYL